MLTVAMVRLTGFGADSKVLKELDDRVFSNGL